MKALVVVCSDSVAAGRADDATGPLLATAQITPGEETASRLKTAGRVDPIEDAQFGEALLQPGAR